MRASIDEFLAIVRYKELLKNLVARDIKVRYKRSVLGFLWVMLNPMLMMLVLSIVFSDLFRVTTKNFTTYLLSGIILWNFFSQSTTTSVVSFLANSNLIKKIYIPKAIFPLSVILSASVNFLFSLVPLFLIMWITHAPLSPYLYLLPVVLILVTLFSFGISLVLSTATVFFHDTIYIYDVLLLAWMYSTPIFYPDSIVAQKFRLILTLNPLYYFLSLFRGTLYLEVSQLFQKLLCASLISVSVFLIGWFVYDRYKDKVVYYL